MYLTGGEYKGYKIEVPKGARPTLSKVRESIFNMLDNLDHGEYFLDMFAGSGIMALEAISRGFATAVAIEKHPKIIQVIRNNYKKYMNSDVELNLIHGDSLKITTKFDRKFNVIYIDPPYYSGVYEEALEAAKQISDGVIILEHVTEVDFGNYTIIKQKKYGDKYITFLKN